MPDVSNIEGLYVHVPFCDGKCYYCAFYSMPYCRNSGVKWLAALKREVAAARKKYGPLQVSTLFMGGGTPTILPLDQLEELVGVLRGCVAPGTLDLEWTSEANPGSVDAENLALLKAAGVNRISLGVQSFDDQVLRQLGRRHTVSDVVASVEAIEEAGFTNWSMDLIACVPGVSMRTWRKTLRTAVAMNPPHLSVYALTSEEGSVLHQDCEDGLASLLDDEEQLQMLNEAEQILESAGLQRYEISNYARPGYECRHNLACWRGQNYLGFGCAAASRVGNRRWVNRPDLDTYYKAVKRDEEILSPATDAVERVIFGLRMREGIDLDAILQATGMAGTVQDGQWRAILAGLQSEGLVLNLGTRWSLTSKGYALADHVAVELMP